MKIEIEVYGGGGFSCLSNDCKFQKSCANHRSAGDYRSEDGFQPDVIAKEGVVYCLTYELPALIENRPRKRGVLLYEQVKIRSSPDYYQI